MNHTPNYSLKYPCSVCMRPFHIAEHQLKKHPVAMNAIVRVSSSWKQTKSQTTPIRYVIPLPTPYLICNAKNVNEIKSGLHSFDTLQPVKHSMLQEVRSNKKVKIHAALQQTDLLLERCEIKSQHQRETPVAEHQDGRGTCWLLHQVLNQLAFSSSPVAQ
jgi:hypothetical protein